MARKKHKAVEFHVSDNRASGRGERTDVYHTWAEASEAAMARAVARGDAVIDVCVFSRAGAKWWGGDEGVERYKEDPEASVFDRFEIDVNYVGRVP